MNIRLRFKLIALLITLSLAGLLVFQGYWLKGLYETLYKQMEINIEEAMKIADYKELFLRIRSVKKEQGVLGPQTQEIYFNSAADSPDEHDTDKQNGTHIDEQDTNTDERKELQTKLPISRLGVSIDYGDDEEEFSSIDSTLTDYLYIIGELEDMVQQAMHANIDSIKPVNFEAYNKLLTLELEARNIMTEHELVTIYKSVNGEEKSWMHLNNPERFTTWKNPTYFDYPLHNESTLLYRLYLKSPASVILTQMKGILISSFLLLLLIICAFIYLLRTILKQKTVEELKTDFTNNMTHELKTPISVGYAAVDALLNFGDPVNEKQRKYLTIVKDQLIHLTGLVEQILTLAVENRSTFRLRPETISLSGLTAPLIEQYRLKANKPVEFTSSIPEDIELVADRTHLYNMLSNLIDNAIKYADKEPCRIEVAARQNDRETTISVTDNGPGISETNLRQIFDKFFRVPQGNIHDVKGYGLGLYYVKDMMGKHGGTVRVESALGKGSTFTLHFKR
ncbi:HAMP domain-containing sensor histidine kinase [uncultured Parabacteroides sp.]|uniref:sensor histidine kinase n=1 Tax=uncultured Parabacteroides sp. TaxID=512312 RepID=UPI002633F46F|nr:HAMP domain-containing sensor histidine kinase [uncultured Parabacteroides sp.]